MKNKLIVSLVSIILLAGVAFGVGIVTGETTDTANTDVTVDVEYVPPTITIDSVTQDIGWQDDVTVEATVTAPGHGNVVDEVVFEFEYVGEQMGGDAVTEVTKEGLQPSNWVEGEGEVDHTFTLADSEMWRAGDWKVNATVYGTDGNADVNYDTATTSVNEHLEINWAEDGEASGQPGDHLYGEDFHVPGGDKQPEINITANDNWQLEFENFTLEHVNKDETITGTGDYDQSLGMPRWKHETSINYDVEIPWGSVDGTYETSEDNATHILSSYGGTIDNLPLSDWTQTKGEYSEEQYEFLLDVQDNLPDPYTLEIYVEDKNGDPFTGEINDTESGDAYIWITNHHGSFNETPTTSGGGFTDLDFEKDGTAEIVLGNDGNPDVTYSGYDVNTFTDSIVIDFDQIGSSDYSDLSVEGMWIEVG